MNDIKKLNNSEVLFTLNHKNYIIILIAIYLIIYYLLKIIIFLIYLIY